MSFQAIRNTLALTLFVTSFVAAFGAAANDQSCQPYDPEDKVCEGYDRKHTVRALGGPSAFHSEPAEVWQGDLKVDCGTLDNLLDKMHGVDSETNLRGELEAILEKQGLARWAPNLWSAIKNCAREGAVRRDPIDSECVDEIESGCANKVDGGCLDNIDQDTVDSLLIKKGCKLDWMTFRKASGPAILGKVLDESGNVPEGSIGLCFENKKGNEQYASSEKCLPHSAFRITVREPVENVCKTAEVPPKCSLRVVEEATCGGPIRLEASPGATVEMIKPVRKQLTGGKLNSEGQLIFLYPGPDDGPLEQDKTYEFVATVQGEAPQAGRHSANYHTFVIPQDCLNLAYGGFEPHFTPCQPPRSTCSTSITVPKCEPSISVRAESTGAGCKKCFEVEVVSEDDPPVTLLDSMVKFVDESGNEVVARSCTDGSEVRELTEPGKISFRKPGEYTLKATAKGCCQESSPSSDGSCPSHCIGGANAETKVTVEKPGWTARFFGLRFDPDDGPLRTSSIRPDGVSERSKLHLGTAVGGGAEIEHHFSRCIGLAASALYGALGTELFFDLDNEWEAADDDSSFLAFLIGPNFHLTPSKKFDLYIGPFIGLADLGSTSYRVLGETQRRNLDAGTVFGGQIGLDIPFGQGDWGVHFGARYMDLNIEIDEGGPEISADPLGIEFGFAYRF
ncbi:MAG: hypothetical protein K0U98_07085 [Deltaproteobacteria bacterium]|nr:hypothetical protein [Deltaproteobacteria bacterium]